MENPDKQEEEHSNNEDQNQSKNIQNLDLNESIKSKDKKEKEKLQIADSNENETPTSLKAPIKVERNKRRKSTYVDIEKARKEVEQKEFFIGYTKVDKLIINLSTMCPWVIRMAARLRDMRGR